MHPYVQGAQLIVPVEANKGTLEKKGELIDQKIQEGKQAASDKADEAKAKYEEKKAEAGQVIDQKVNEAKSNASAKVEELKQNGAEKYEAAKDAAAQKGQEIQKNVGDKVADAGKSIKDKA